MTNQSLQESPPVELSVKETSYGSLAARRILLGLLITSGLLTIVFIVVAITTSQYHNFILAGVFALTFVFTTLSMNGFWKAPEGTRILVITLALEAGIALVASVYSSFGAIPYAVIAIMVSLILSATLTRSKIGQWMIVIGLIGAVTAIQLHLSQFFPKNNDPRISAWIAVIAVTLSALVVFFFLKRIIVATLRTKLTLGALGVTIIPLLILSLISSQYLQSAIQEQSNQALSVAAQQTSSTVDNFLSTSLDSIGNESSLPSIVAYLLLDEIDRSNSIEESELSATLFSLRTKQEIYLPSYAVLSNTGKNLFDTTSININKEEGAENYFTQVLTTGIATLSSVEFDQDTHEAFITVISPVKDENAQIIGYLRAQYNARILQSIINENAGLMGKYSYPVLLDENGVRLADGFSPNQVFTAVGPLLIDIYSSLLLSNRLPSYIAPEKITIRQDDFYAAITDTTGSNFFSTNMTVKSENVPYFGTVTKLQEKPWSLIYIQDQTSLVSALQSQTQISTTLSSLMAGLIGILVTIVANLFTNPILRLTDAAGKVTAGDLEISADVTSNDEIGTLGSAFNQMTSQLKEFIETLESRVRERTQQLAQQNESLLFRSRQLQTVADVARSIVSSREVESQLNSVTRLVSERFGFYHVGVFLIDDRGEYAELKASNSPGGRKMLARHHRLRVGQVGIVGYVTNTGDPRIATDVGEDAVFFNNPDLPETRSEMAIPLKLEDRIIGALDVQSTQSNAFSEEDITLFTTLADQIAVGINNNQLFEETTRALEESQKLYRQYLLQEWTKQTSDYSTHNYKYSSSGLTPFEEDIPEINMVLESGRPLNRSHKSTQNPDEITSVLAVPILLHGQSIGAIYLEDTADSTYMWSQKELQTVQSVADQVAQTLESARLFEQTIRRADRERKVLEITSKIRSTSDPQEMLKIALEELKKNLGFTQGQIVLNVSDVSPTES